MRTKGYAVYILLIFIFVSCETLSSTRQKNTRKDMSEVCKKELQYLHARISNNFYLLYSFQHPEYKAIIGMDRFISSGGNLMLNYSAVTEKNPQPQIFTPSQQFPTIKKGFRIGKCLIDKNGRYVKFHTILIVDIIFPFANGMAIEREIESTDYWEKLNGEWFVLNKVRSAPFAHISGAATKNPINLPEEKAEYIEIPIKEIESVFEEKKSQK